MDISDLERKLGIDGISAEQQMEIITALQQSAAEKIAKAKSESIGKGAELVIQGLKKIRSDMEQKFALLNTDIQSKVSAIQDGRDGKDGKDGRDGKQGPAGATGPRGRDGVPGRDGVDGANGTGVASARIDFDGSLIIVFDDGREVNAGEVVPFDIAERIKVITNGGGTSQYVLDTLVSLQDQIDAISGGLVYKGTWNASTNSPTLASGTGTTNWYYVVSTPGSTNLDGITDWKAGDWLIFNGTVWQKIDQSWAIAGANDNITSMTGITGGISSPDFIQFDTAATVTNAIGKLYWDATQETLTVGLTADIAADIGQTLYAYVTNAEAVTITKGQPVYMFEAQGDRMTVKLASNSGDATSAKTLGLCAEDIGANQTGLVLCQGVQDGLNLGSYSPGDTLYLGATAGTLTSTKPYAPNHLVYIGVVERANNGNGRLYVRVQNGYELDELHNVSAQNPTNGQTLIYNESTSLWEKHTLTAGTGIDVTNGAGSITIDLESAYGDTLNPYASKTAKYFLAAPNGASGVPTFRAMVASDVPTLNQNTTGSAGSVATTNFSIEESGGKLLFKYGATTIASMSSTGVITSATNIVANGTP
jgi:Collagen triple helix repeat (20 copies)